MGKINIGEKVMIELQKVGSEEIIPSKFERENYLPWGSVTQQIQKWEENGKVVCINKAVTPYISRFSLTKYAQS